MTQLVVDPARSRRRSYQHARSILFPRTFTRALMERLGVSRGTVCLWQRGLIKPPAGALRVIAELWNRPLDDIVELLWKKTLGGPGICGCGINRFPEDPKARTVLIEIACTRCSAKRFSQPGAHVNHHPLCRKCSHAGEWLEFTCVGYDDHGVKRHARTCLPPYKKRVQRQQATNLEGQKKRHNLRLLEQINRPKLVLSDGSRDRTPIYPSRFDLSSKTYQCQGCSKAERLAKRWEERLREFRANNKPKQTIKFRSRRQRLQEMKKLSSQINPNFKPPFRTGRKLGRKKSSGRSLAGALVRRWSGKNLPQNVRFAHCRVCKKIVIMRKKVTEIPSPKFHNICYMKWLSTPEGRIFKSLRRRRLKARSPSLGAGQFMTEENLKTTWSFIIQHRLARKPKSLRTIGDDNRLDHKTVDARIRFFMHKLDPDLLPPPFQRAARLIIEVSKKPFSPSHSALNG